MGTVFGWLWRYLVPRFIRRQWKLFHVSHAGTLWNRVGLEFTWTVVLGLLPVLVVLTSFIISGKARERWDDVFTDGQFALAAAAMVGTASYAAMKSGGKDTVRWPATSLIQLLALLVLTLATTIYLTIFLAPADSMPGTRMIVTSTFLTYVVSLALGFIAAVVDSDREAEGALLKASETMDTSPDKLAEEFRRRREEGRGEDK